MLDRVDAEASQQIFAEHDRDAAKRVRADEDQLRPAEQETRQPSPSFAEIGVEAARLRQRRGQFSQ